MCLAIPGKLLDTFGEDAFTRQGRVSFAGITKRVNLAYVPDARPGNYVVVHAGFAISIMDEAEALRTLSYFSPLPMEDSREIR